MKKSFLYNEILLVVFLFRKLLCDVFFKKSALLNLTFKAFFKKILFCSSLLFLYCYADEAKVDESSQNPEIRSICKEAQELEQKISKLETEIDSLNQKEKNSTPVVKNIYEILTRCFTILFDIQRFSNVLALNQQTNKNDFVKCSNVIKNFGSYFKLVLYHLEKNSSEIITLKKEKMAKRSELNKKMDQYKKIIANIDKKISELPRVNEETIIQNVVYHIATKCTSIDELDAELESENAVGVLKNTKISTELSLTYPVSGKIITEFGDKGPNGEMIYCISFETRSGAIVTSPVKGLAVFSGKFMNYGNMVILSNGEYRIFLYGMDSVFTNTGEVIEIGDFIGKMKDGQAENPVIKIELRKSGEPLDPRHWLFQTLEKEK
ncbi:MAG: peptidoglycan DD-metalloendopeptidase family protein [Holosporaceae bacterium]|jgi:septal ring factor EnvC (AmiA/AmiB activator)|nr:peptidoglycan DD-metalloendopeptidase family protein [Holosporaceae bacterium]